MLSLASADFKLYILICMQEEKGQEKKQQTKASYTLLCGLGASVGYERVRAIIQHAATKVTEESIRSLCLRLFITFPI